MFRYRVIRQASGRYLVLPALLSLVPIEETYATRSAAQQTADWLNGLRHGQPQGGTTELSETSSY